MENEKNGIVVSISLDIEELEQKIEKIKKHLVDIKTSMNDIKISVQEIKDLFNIKVEKEIKIDGEEITKKITPSINM